MFKRCPAGNTIVPDHPRSADQASRPVILAGNNFAAMIWDVIGDKVAANRTAKPKH